jgi:hypothetical protein
MHKRDRHLARESLPGIEGFDFTRQARNGRPRLKLEGEIGGLEVFNWKRMPPGPMILLHGGFLVN